MSVFSLNLLSALRSERIEGLSSFIGADASGSFGIQAGRARYMTVLGYGLARYRLASDDWCYLALPGGVLRFADNQLTLCTRRYLRDHDYQRISSLLAGQLAREEEALQDVKDNLEKLEQSLMLRLRSLERGR
jgi:F-type H+-transporting ATPase subunit epsilon